MKAKKYTLSALLIALGSVGAYYGYERFKTYSQPKFTVKVAAPKLPSSGLVALASSMGFFENNYCKVEIRYQNTGKECMEVLKNFEADLAVAFDTPVVVNVINGLPLHIITELHRSYKNTAIVYRKDRFQRHGDVDLTRHKIGVIPGTNADFYLSLYSLYTNVARDDIDVVAQTWQTNYTDLIEGKVDAAIMWEPFVNNLQTDSGRFGVARYPLFTEVSMLVARVNPVGHPMKCYQSIVEALLQAEEYYDRNKPEARKIIGAALGFSREETPDNVWDNFEFYTGLSATLVTILNMQYNWYALNAPPGENHPVKSLEPKFLATVNPSKVTFR